MKRFVSLALILAAVSCGGGTDPVPVASLTITPAGPVLDTLFSIGESVQLNVTAKDANGGNIQGARITYSVSNDDIIDVSNTGVVTAIANGTANVTATSGGVSESRTVPVRQKLNSLFMSPQTFSLVIGTTRTLQAAPRDARGNLIIGLPLATFQSLATGVASVSATGLVTGQSLGSTTINAALTTTDGTRNGTATVTVIANFPNAVTIVLQASAFAPSEVDISAGGTVTFSNTSATTHNINFSAGGPANVGDHSSGQNQRTFPTAGTFDFQCNIHAGMAGRITVH